MEILLDGEPCLFFPPYPRAQSALAWILQLLLAPAVAQLQANLFTLLL